MTLNPASPWFLISSHTSLLDRCPLSTTHSIPTFVFSVIQGRSGQDALAWATGEMQPQIFRLRFAALKMATALRLWLGERRFGGEFFLFAVMRLCCVE
jgi:hypothetical protein